MSGDPLHGSSVGASAAQPPTPTSAVLSSPGFQTPNHDPGHFDEAGGWTPRFADELSVFSSTPGNLRGAHGSFIDFDPIVNSPIDAEKRRHLSDDKDLECGVAQADNLSHRPSPSHSPVKPAVDPPVSTGSLNSIRGDAALGGHQPGSPTRSFKKARRGTVGEDSQGQTATPPASRHKGNRKLAPKLNIKMQNEQIYGHAEFADVSQQDMGPLAAWVGDTFEFPFLAPAAAASFWDVNADTSGMNFDFGNGTGATLFDAQSLNHRPMGPTDWTRANQIVQATAAMPMASQENIPPPTTNVAGSTDPKSSLMHMKTSDCPSAYNISYTTSMDNPFNLVASGGGVNPDLLFSNPHTVSMDATSFQVSMQHSNVSLPPSGQSLQTIIQAPLISKAPTNCEARRAAITEETGPAPNSSLPPVGSSVKLSRPGLPRSSSESRRKPVNRLTLPPLAPAPSQTQSQTNLKSAAQRVKPNATPQARRSNGRSSPIKSQLHRRLSSMPSIPEAVSRTRTQARFMIDENGRAQVKTTVILKEGDPCPLIQQTCRSQYLRSCRLFGEATDDDDASSTDDEPIYIPSRPTSFVLPDPIRPTGSHLFHNPKRKLSERITASLSPLPKSSNGEPYCEADTVTEEVAPVGQPSGDATIELWRLRGRRKKSVTPSKPKLSLSSLLPRSSNYYGRNMMSPLPHNESNLPTPSTGSAGSRTRDHEVRCICGRHEFKYGQDGFMVQCDSCETFLHGPCVNLTKHTMPHVYICGYCGDTPRAHDMNRTAIDGPCGSPCARKSFRGFRR